MGTGLNRSSQSFGKSLCIQVGQQLLSHNRGLLGLMLLKLVLLKVVLGVMKSTLEGIISASDLVMCTESQALGFVGAGASQVVLGLLFSCRPSLMGLGASDCMCSCWASLPMLSCATFGIDEDSPLVISYFCLVWEG